MSDWRESDVVRALAAERDDARAEVERLREELEKIDAIARVSTTRSWRNVPCEEIAALARDALERPRTGRM